MGSIRKKTRKDGTTAWEVVVDISKPGEPRKQRTRSFDSEREAKKAEAKWQAEIDAGIAVDTSKKTVAQLLDEWQAICRRKNLRPITLQTYRRAINQLLPRIGSVQIQKLTGATLDSLYTAMQEDPKKPVGVRTIELCHLCMRQALQLAVKRKELPRNVTEDATPPRSTPRKMRVWTQEEAQQFLDVAEADRFGYGPIWLLALTTGMRRGELLGLRWQDVHLEEGYLRIEQTLSEVDNKIVFGPPKSKASARAIHLIPEVVDALRQHRTEQIERRLGFGHRWRDTDLVFTASEGQPIIPTNLQKKYNRLIKAAGVPYINIHSLRHTAISNALADGAPIKAVSEYVGHARTSITLNTYAHVLPHQRTEVADKMGGGLLRRRIQEAM